MPKIAHYGWIPDLPDQRDYQYAAPIAAIGILPTNVDLTSACPASMTRANWVVVQPMPSQAQSSSSR